MTLFRGRRPFGVSLACLAMTVVATKPRTILHVSGGAALGHFGQESSQAGTLLQGTRGWSIVLLAPFRILATTIRRKKVLGAMTFAQPLSRIYHVTGGSRSGEFGHESAQTTALLECRPTILLVLDAGLERPLFVLIVDGLLFVAVVFVASFGKLFDFVSSA